MTGIALIASELPVSLLEVVADRMHDRSGCLEVRFESWRDPPLLPVRWDGSLRLLQWGSRDRRSRLPLGGLITCEQMNNGNIAYAEEVVIPANYGFSRGTWFLIDQGIRGVVVPEAAVVYILMDRSTNYYRNMTGQSDLMPMLVDQVI